MRACTLDKHQELLADFGSQGAERRLDVKARFNNLHEFALLLSSS